MCIATQGDVGHSDAIPGTGRDNYNLLNITVSYSCLARSLRYGFPFPADAGRRTSQRRSSLATQSDAPFSDAGS